MDAVNFLNAIAADTQEAVSDLIMPCKPQKGDTEGIRRAPVVYKMRLSKSSAAQRMAPYIIQQIITMDAVKKPGQEDSNKVCLRSIFCVYNGDDEQEGSMALLTLMERVKIHWLRTCLIDERYELDKEQGIQGMVYPDETQDFYIGEMVSYWDLPTIKREVAVVGYNY